MLAGPGEVPNILYHALRDRVPIVKVIIEEPVDRGTFLRRRLKTLGWGTVAGQLAFSALVVPVLRRSSRSRIAELKSRFGFREEAIPPDATIRVPSANSEEAIRALEELKPAVVLLAGTRVIARRVLEQVPATFINLHSGITPAYRGVHGGYWALAAGDRDRCGVTVHLVDAGIDTGAIVDQAVIQPDRTDTFVTYFYHQLHAGIPLLERALLDALQGRLASRAARPGESRLWSHPTVWQYLANRVRRGVR